MFAGPVATVALLHHADEEKNVQLASVQDEMSDHQKTFGSRPRQT